VIWNVRRDGPMTKAWGPGNEGPVSVSTDPLAVIQAAVLSCGGTGGTVEVEAGNWQLQGQLNIPSNVTLRGQGRDATNLVFSDQASFGLAATGVEPNGVALAANLNEGDLTATLTSGGGASFSVGQLVRLHSTSTLEGYWATYIAGIAGDVLTFNEPAPTNMTTANSADVASMTGYAQNISIRDLTVSVAWGSSPLLLRIIQLNKAAFCNIRDVRFLATGGDNPGIASSAAILTFNSYAVNVRDCLAEGILKDTTAIAYRFSNAYACSAIGNEARNCSGGISFENSPGWRAEANRCFGSAVSGGRGIKAVTCSPHGVAVGNLVRGYRTAVYTGIQLDDSWACTITGNTVEDCNGAGINLTGTIATLMHHNVITGNIVRRVCLNTTVGTGAIVIGAGTGAGSVVTGHVVEGNSIHWVPGTAGGITIAHGISVSSSGNVVKGNTIDAVGGAGVILSTATVNNQVEGNAIVNTSGGTITTTNAIDSSSGTGNIIGRNYLGGIAPVYKTGALTGDAIQNGPFMNVITQTGGGTLTIDAALGDYVFITVTDATAFTLGSPSHRSPAQRLAVTILNSSGGVMGAITFSTGWKGSSTVVKPASTNKTSFEAFCDGSVWNIVGIVNDYVG
jgi:parallel beta-helix repeat protein